MATRSFTSFFYWLSIISTGILCGLLTIYFIPVKWEIALWLLLILMIGLMIRNRFKENLFKHGFRAAFIMGITITMTHLKFLADYLNSHPDEASIIRVYFAGFSEELALLIIAPFYWVIFGVVSGLSALVLKKK